MGSPQTLVLWEGKGWLRQALLSQPLAPSDGMILPMPLPLLRSELATGFLAAARCPLPSLAPPGPYGV